MKKSTKTITIVATAILVVATIVLLIITMNKKNTAPTGETTVNTGETAAGYKEEVEKLKAAGDYKKAIVILQNYLIENDKCIDAYVEEADAYRHIGGDGNATEIYDKAIALVDSTVAKEQTEAVKKLFMGAADVYKDDINRQKEYILKGEELLPGIFKEYFGVEHVTATDKDGTSLLSDEGPLKKDDKTIEFGWYPGNSRVTDGKLLKVLELGEFNSNNLLYYEDKLYIKVSDNEKTEYFSFEPIEWEIYQETGKEIYLQTRYAIDTQAYHDAFENVEYADSTIRSWLNGEFLTTAFPGKLADMIKETKVRLGVNPALNVSYTKQAVDKVYLYNILEAIGAPFVADTKAADPKRVCLGTDYAVSKGLHVNDDKSAIWWLQGPGQYLKYAQCVGGKGVVSEEGTEVNYKGYGVRPIICISKNFMNGEKNNE